MLKIDEVMPIPSASVITTKAVSAGVRRRLRIADRASCSKFSMNSSPRSAR